MNLNGIIDMILRRVIGQLVNRGVDAGINAAARRGRAPGDDGQDAQQLTPEEQARARQAKEAAKRTRQAARVMRKLR